MIAFILAKFINTVGLRSVASNAVKMKLNPQRVAEAALEPGTVSAEHGDV